MIKNIKKLLVIFILIISYIIINLICGNQVFAITQTTSTDVNSIDSNKYPQVKEKLQSLQKEHPNWKFKILYTDIDWSDAIANEYVNHKTSPRNLVPANNSNYNGAWICSVCGKKTYDSGSWHCASELAIAYMMDPRNSTNSSDIFQFMELSYTECNIEYLRKMVENTFLNSETCITAILEAAEKHDVNAYYIVARILQEQGKNGSTLSLGKGYKEQYVGFYNVFNIGASGNGKETVILNGLKYAEDKEWTSLESSIIGGTEIIAKSYIARGQNTLYLQKFDVDNSDDNLYWHQYMQNILAAQKEGQTLRNTFRDMGTIEAEYTFVIPVFKNMPTKAVERPSNEKNESTVITDLVKVNVTGSLYLRDEPKKDANKIGSVYKDQILTRLEKATEKVDGTYWDYVMTGTGVKGYAARETYEGESSYKLYLVPVNQAVTDTEIPTIENDKIKIEKQNNTAVTIPGVTVEELLNLIGKEVVVKNVNGEILPADAKLGTGYVINDTYKISVLGDVNGDAEINSGDLFYTQKYLLKKVAFELYTIKACDVNKDNEINSGDLFFIQKYLLKKTDFSI